MNERYVQPQMGATFYPGGIDDFYMPEVVSPAPQRIMPEVPENIQGNLAHLELGADNSRNFTSAASPQPPPHGFAQPPQTHTAGRGLHKAPSWQVRGNESSQIPHRVSKENLISLRSQQQSRPYDPIDLPSFSPFPKLHNPPPNVPPTDDEKEAILERARVAVLGSQDPEVQLAWAQDALTYVEIAAENESRLAKYQPPRPGTPEVEHQLRVDAINIVQFLADQGHPHATFLRGMWLEFGKFGFRMDKKEAFRCYCRASDGGYARAEYRIGMQYESSNDAAKAVRHYKRGLDAGDSAATYRLGMMNLFGQYGEPRDYVLGVERIRFAAEHADENAPQGAYVYGMLQSHSLPQVVLSETTMPLDINNARIYIEKAAYLGFSKAQMKMGSAYELCQLGCDFDPALSLHYNALAARQGEAEAEMAISKWFLCGFEGIFQKNEELAFRYAQRAAGAGLATAEFAMGYFYEVGVHVPVDLGEARAWYAKAADHGNKDATARLEGISRSKTLSKKYHESVALARIKSQYGTQKRRESEHIQASATPPVPLMSEPAVEMPDPAKMSPISPSAPAASFTYGIKPPIRPATAAPYPLEDGPPAPGVRPAIGVHGMSSPAIRPTSAFGINPNLRPTSAATVTGVPPPAPYIGGQSPRVNPQRPFPVMDGSGMGPTMGRGRGAYPPRLGSAGPGTQPYRGSAGVDPRGRPGNNTRPPIASGASAPPTVDIGYSAPLDPPPTEQRNRRRLQDHSESPPLSPHPQAQRPPTDDRRTPTRIDSPGRPIPPISQAAGKTPSPKPGSAALPAPAKASEKPAASALAKPPGKGPKTFDEMGVPAVKDSGECTIM
ncbi:HCP-like protein [Xylona heveae TC161]|uniref:HCP-like protein n=1 Tax=Xylona heveae (strain CBS 132557 / TC161) TaxID=1328760 RepID=A0A165G6X6_XYLHT|nr:HCP-like protein [Xylona heveae TC161]KZF21809.1 HCP-like protein [Xylona heveae TC161]